MPYPNLQDFLAALETEGELKRITQPISPFLEVAALADRASKSAAPNPSATATQFDPTHAHLGGPALLCENVTGSSIPLAINTFGSYRRVELALGCSEGGFEALAQSIENLVKPQPPSGIMEKMKKGLELAKIASFAPKIVRSAPCQQNVILGQDINLLELPIIKCWPQDGDPSAFGYPFPLQQPGQGRYITLGAIFTIHPDDLGKPEGTPRPSRNIGMYRAQILDEKTTAMHWHIHHDGARHWRAWKEHNEKHGTHEQGMPCAIVLGGESVIPYAATAPLPPGISELLLAGFLNQKAIDLVPCKTVDLHVPANAELVIEGTVATDAGTVNYDPRTRTPEQIKDDLKNAHFEGPFGDHTGFYSLPDRYPLFTATALTHRNNPVYPTTVVGPPPQEDYFLGKATERIFLPLLKTIIPDIIDYHLPMFGAFHNAVFIQIKKEYPLQARRIMHAIWGAGQMAWTKMIVVVDHTVNVHDTNNVLFHLAANCDPGRDIEITRGPLDILDHAAPYLGAGSKIGFDATTKLPDEASNGYPVRTPWPTYLGFPDETTNRINEIFDKL